MKGRNQHPHDFSKKIDSTQKYLSRAVFDMYHSNNGPLTYKTLMAVGGKPHITPISPSTYQIRKRLFPASCRNYTNKNTLTKNNNSRNVHYSKDNVPKIDLQKIDQSQTSSKKKRHSFSIDESKFNPSFRNDSPDLQEKVIYSLENPHNSETPDNSRLKTKISLTLATATEKISMESRFMRDSRRNDPESLSGESKSRSLTQLFGLTAKQMTISKISSDIDTAFQKNLQAVNKITRKSPITISELDSPSRNNFRKIVRLKSNERKFQSQMSQEDEDYDDNNPDESTNQPYQSSTTTNFLIKPSYNSAIKSGSQLRLKEKFSNKISETSSQVRQLSNTSDITSNLVQSDQPKVFIYSKLKYGNRKNIASIGTNTPKIAHHIPSSSMTHSPTISKKNSYISNINPSTIQMHQQHEILNSNYSNIKPNNFHTNFNMDRVVASIKGLVPNYYGGSIIEPSSGISNYEGSRAKGFHSFHGKIPFAPRVSKTAQSYYRKSAVPSPAKIKEHILSDSTRKKLQAHNQAMKLRKMKFNECEVVPELHVNSIANGNEPITSKILKRKEKGLAVANAAKYQHYRQELCPKKKCKIEIKLEDSIETVQTAGSDSPKKPTFVKSSNPSIIPTENISSFKAPENESRFYDDLTKKEVSCFMQTLPLFEKKETFSKEKRERGNREFLLSRPTHTKTPHDIDGMFTPKNISSNQEKSPSIFEMSNRYYQMNFVPNNPMEHWKGQKHKAPLSEIYRGLKKNKKQKKDPTHNSSYKAPILSKKKSQSPVSKAKKVEDDLSHYLAFGNSKIPNPRSASHEGHYSLLKIMGIRAKSPEFSPEPIHPHEVSSAKKPPSQFRNENSATPIRELIFENPNSLSKKTSAEDYSGMKEFSNAMPETAEQMYDDWKQNYSKKIQIVDILENQDFQSNYENKEDANKRENDKRITRQPMQMDKKILGEEWESDDYYKTVFDIHAKKHFKNEKVIERLERMNKNILELGKIAPSTTHPYQFYRNSQKVETVQSAKRAINSKYHKPEGHSNIYSILLFSGEGKGLKKDEKVPPIDIDFTKKKNKIPPHRYNVEYHPLSGVRNQNKKRYFK